VPSRADTWTLSCTKVYRQSINLGHAQFESEALWNIQSAYKFNPSAILFEFRNPDILSDTDILASGKHLPVCWPYFHCIDYAQKHLYHPIV